MTRPSAKTAVRLAARAALDKRAHDLAVLDLSAISGIADYFLICSARSATQADTVAEAVRVALRADGVSPRHLLDYGDVVVHVFLEETRQFYALERLWGDAPLLSVEG